MRHLGSIALSIVLTPIIYVLLGYGVVKLDAGSGFAEAILGAPTHTDWTKVGIGAVALLAAGGALAALVMPKLSPLGPVLGGLIFFGLGAWFIAAPSSELKLLKPDTLDGALVAPLALSLFLCVPLFGTIFSPRRWRGPDQQGAAVAATGYPGYATAGQSANPYATPADQYAAGNPYAAQAPYPTYPPQDPYAAGAVATEAASPYPGPMAAPVPAPAPTAVMPQAAPETVGYGAPAPGYPAPSTYPAPGYPAGMPGSPTAMPGYPAGMPGSPSAMPGSPSAMPGSPSAMPGSPLPPVAPVATTPATMPIGQTPPAATPVMPAAAPIPTPPSDQADMFARTQLVYESDIPAPPAPQAAPASPAPQVYGTPPVASAPPVSGGSTGNVYGQPAAAAYAEPSGAGAAGYGEQPAAPVPTPNLYGQAATPPPAGGEQPPSPGNVYGQPSPTGNVYGQPSSDAAGAGVGPASTGNVYGQPAAPEQISPAAPAGPIYPAPNQVGPVADSDNTVVDAPMPPAGPAHPRPE